jgi:hypothetical protein
LALWTFGSVERRGLNRSRISFRSLNPRLPVFEPTLATLLGLRDSAMEQMVPVVGFQRAGSSPRSVHASFTVRPKQNRLSSRLGSCRSESYRSDGSSQRRRRAQMSRTIDLRASNVSRGGRPRLVSDRRSYLKCTEGRAIRFTASNCAEMVAQGLQSHNGRIRHGCKVLGFGAFRDVLPSTAAPMPPGQWSLRISRQGTSSIGTTLNVFPSAKGLPNHTHSNWRLP